MGKPTSDELKKMEVRENSNHSILRLTFLVKALRKFQEAHPELDLSNAKIS